MSLKSKMGILYLCQYFKTLNQPEGTRSYYFAKGLVEKGHNVIMIVSKSYFWCKLLLCIGYIILYLCLYV